MGNAAEKAKEKMEPLVRMIQGPIVKEEYIPLQKYYEQQKYQFMFLSNMWEGKKSI